ncbi:MAG: hypothetical protein V2A62_05290 [Candidatus Woesearchaeota archaeon]
MGLEKRKGKMWFVEDLYPDIAQAFEVTKVLYEEMSKDAQGKPLQDLKVLQSPRHGIVLIIDGIVQTTTNDEIYYHEPIVHCAVNSCAHVPQTALLIGCDGGTLREIVKYKFLKRIDVVDIDRKVIDLMLKYMPSVPGKAFNDKRVNLTIADGFDYVKERRAEGKKYDIIVVDSPDPIGAGASLFKKEFYEDLSYILAPGGVLIRQTGSGALQPQEMPDNYKSFKKAFPQGEIQGFISAVPTYYGGYFTFLGASNKKGVFKAALKGLNERLKSSGLDLNKLQWYSADMHHAAMVLPAWMQRQLK